MKGFIGYHSEWNLGSPGGWDYQRITQIIGKAVWERLNRIRSIGVDVDFDDPLLFPIDGFVAMLLKAHKAMAGNGSLVAVVAEEETLESVTENQNLAKRLDSVQGVSGALMAPHELELKSGTVCWKGLPVSIIFMDFNTDVLLSLHRKQNLTPLLQAVREGRVINPRGTEPINVKSMFEVLGGPNGNRFHKDIVERTPWTRQFYPRSTQGPKGEEIDDLIEWTRLNWDDLVLKPERGYSGKGVCVGKVNCDVDEAIDLAFKKGNYIVQEKIPLELWAEDIPVLDLEKGELALERVQTDFRCLVGPSGLFGFLSRYGGVPTNVGSGGGVQPLAVLRANTDPGEVVDQINETILGMPFGDVLEVIEMQKEMTLEHRFTYLLGPIKIALRPRIVTNNQLAALKDYCADLWSDCLSLEKMWLEGELDGIVKIEEEELEIARLQPWGGSPAIIASDGLFCFR
ncbi:MAG: hypothetical protein JRD47_00915 [Deltaproteobacteria bacterium]|nr:hypothetical protein [Deltaproteobacteria bacterium]MBW2317700.1 hypothetical protein [Deltaproteobacteria bacterium]MBW2600480.1 hypothetical protein [Deltaproteobacteria bacterium]OEU45670.1 MAG: hypothetical protein BBJ60_08345 [Desulfobacterales bacterium S7086C20]